MRIIEKSKLWLWLEQHDLSDECWQVVSWIWIANNKKQNSTE